MLIENQIEINAINHIINKSDNVYYPPENAIIEWWDIIVWKDYLFVWQGKRTNQKGLTYIKKNNLKRKTTSWF